MSLLPPAMRKALLLSLLVPTLLAGCGGESVYPPRPPATPGEAIADPAPSRITLHATITAGALKAALEESVPREGDGTFPLAGSQRRFTWKRGPLDVRFHQGRIALEMRADVVADMPISHLDFPLDLHLMAEPVITSEYVARLQSLDVQVSSDSRTIKLADAAADVLGTIKKEMTAKLGDFSYDLRPVLGEAFQRIAKPIDLPLGDAHGCAALRLLGVEAGPTVLADGIEKDLAAVIAPSVTIPCSAEATTALPPLANVATIQPGPFTVSVPIAARYDELAKAMTLAFTNGKLFFAKDFPELYLDKPEVYAAKDEIVLKLHIGGPVSKYGLSTDLDGDLFMTGHPVVEDNELRVPDLEPTIETSSFLLKLTAALGGNTIRDQARAALKLDIGERLKSVKEKLSTDLSFGNGQGCVKASADKIEVSSVHVHAGYLRVYVGVTGRVSVYLPCPAPPG
jgi:hypothetical protein